MKKTTIGGQALIEGMMMIGPENAAIAIRKPDGEIIVEKRPLPAKSKFFKVPVLRGIVGFFRQMVIGVKALMFSAEFVEVSEEGEEDKKPGWLDNVIEKMFGDKFQEAAITFSVIVSITFSVGLFILLPNLFAAFIGFNKKTTSGVIYYNLFEGALRMALFVGYLTLASMMKDIKRVWQYHGAEHKTIHCYEHEEELTVENIRKYSTKHPRCGTSFMFLVMIISVLVFSFTGLHAIWLNMLIRLALVPLVAGLSYEVLKFAGRSNLKIMNIVNAPGFAFQLLTTKEPDDSQIEVAIAAFNGVVVEDREADKW